MFDRDRGDIAEFQHRAQGGVGVQDIIERELFALKLLGAGDGRAGVALRAVECRALMRIFAVAHVLKLGHLNIDGLSPALRLFVFIQRRKVIRDRAVIMRGVLKGLCE